MLGSRIWDQILHWGLNVDDMNIRFENKYAAVGINLSFSSLSTGLAKVQLMIYCIQLDVDQTQRIKLGQRGERQDSFLVQSGRYLKKILWSGSVSKEFYSGREANTVCAALCWNHGWTISDQKWHLNERVFFIFSIDMKWE